MPFDLRWSIDAVRDLQHLQRTDADRITRKVVWFCAQSNPLRHAEPLTGSFIGISRFRVGDYRVLFNINDRGHVSILMVLRIKHRRDVYR